jgi:replicative DNA helicase
MSYQLALCSRVVRTGNIAPVLNFGITIDDFTTNEARAFWNLILAYYTQHESRGSIVAPTMLQGWFKDLILHDDIPSMTIEALCYEVRRERVIVEGNRALVAYSEEVSLPTANPAAALSRLQKSVSDLIALGTVANSDVPLSAGLSNIMQQVQLAKTGVNRARMDWPWEALNDATFGLQPDDYIIFYGRPKSMKTWVLVYLIAWAYEHEKRILVYTKEMTPDNVYHRVISCIARLPYDDVRGALSGYARNDPARTASIEHAEKVLSELHTFVKSAPGEGERLQVLSGRDVSAGGDTVSWLKSKVEQYKPDILFVDGLYLLSDQRKATSDHVRVMNISRDLRNLVLHTGVPLVATMQANRKAAAHGDANLDEIAYSDAISQDATIAARVINDKNAPTISILIGGSREFKLHGFRINGVPSTDFTFHSQLTEQDALKAREGDQEPSEKKPKKDSIRRPATTPDLSASGVSDAELGQRIAAARP